MDVATVENGWRVAIQTKYLGPTNHRGSRVKVQRCDHRPGDPTLTISWQSELNSEENHAEAIRQFLTKMEWGGRWVMGGTERGYVAVQVELEKH